MIVRSKYIDHVPTIYVIAGRREEADVFVRDPAIEGKFNVVYFETAKDAVEYFECAKGADLRGYCVGTWREVYENIKIIDILLMVQDYRNRSALTQARRAHAFA